MATKTRRICSRASTSPSKPDELSKPRSDTESSLSPVPSDFERNEPIPTPSKKRKRKAPTMKSRIKNEKLESEMNVDIEDVVPPANWKAQFEALREFRRTGASAAVDTMGCDVHDHLDPKTRRLHCLISLMLSAQCKDEANALVMATLKRTLPNGLTIEDLLDIDQEALALLIRPSGMHNRKAGYIKKAVQVLRDQYGGDVPDTAEGMMSLPGVGPKMAMLCMGSAWDQVVGIGVDTHVHRICNLLGWVDTNAPEKTRLALESWLPKIYWREINHMLVGHGQLTCRPIGRKCSKCPLSQEGVLRCPSVVAYETSPKKKVKSEVKLEDEVSSDRPSYDSRFPLRIKAERIEESEGALISSEARIKGETGTDLDRVPEEKMEDVANRVSPYFKHAVKQEPA